MSTCLAPPVLGCKQLAGGKRQQVHVHVRRSRCSLACQHFRRCILVREPDGRGSCARTREAGRHAAERYSIGLASQIALVAGTVAIQQSDTLREYGDTIGVLGGAALQFGVILPYSRRHELEADRLGVDYMYRSGYRVSQAPRLWELMAARSSGNRPPEFMSTHPDPERRATELRQYINARGYDLV